MSNLNKKHGQLKQQPSKETTRQSTHLKQPGGKAIHQQSRRPEESRGSKKK